MRVTYDFQMANGGRVYNTCNGNGLDLDCGMAREVSRNSKHQKKLEEIYFKYPRKLGKSAGMSYLRTHCKTEEDFKKLSMAVDNYVLFLKRENTEPQYIKYFSTWAREWKDWLDDGHGSVTLEKAKLDLSDVDFDR